MVEKPRTKLRSIHSTKASRSGMVNCFRSQTLWVATSKPVTSGPTNVLLCCPTIRSIISPLEIDNVIRQIPDVADVATVGVPDGTYGKQVVVDAIREKSPDAVLEHCGGLLADFKMPHEVIFRDALPKTGRGKMDRNAL